MNQNQTVDNDLQKAIDDITNTTSADPVFSDPVAAPSSIPEGDTGELSEPIGPFPGESKIEMVAPAPEPIAPLQSANIPELNMPPMEEPPIIKPPETPKIEEAKIEELKVEEQPLPETPASTPSESLAPTEKLNVQQIKSAALQDLVPLLDHINMEPSQKFNIYRDVFEDSKDYTILESAYKSAREISDESKRAEALLYLVESIDKM